MKDKPVAKVKQMKDFRLKFQKSTSKNEFPDYFRSFGLHEYFSETKEC